MTGYRYFDEFWLDYLRAHSDRRTRLFHYAGTAIGILGFAIAAASGAWWIFAAGILCGYLCAWTAHFLVEENRPVSFSGPRAVIYSFVSDLRMFILGVTGKLDPELRRAGI